MAHKGVQQSTFRSRRNMMTQYLQFQGTSSDTLGVGA